MALAVHRVGKALCVAQESGTGESCFTQDCWQRALWDAPLCGEPVVKTL